MSLSFIIFRIISGSVLLVVGFLTADGFFSKEPLLRIPFLGQVLAAFVSGAAGLYVIPFLVVRIFALIVRWLTSLIQVTVQTTVARAMGSFFTSQAGRFRRRRKVETGEGAKSSVNGKTRVILDTSSIIDGRIFDVARSNFLSGDLLVPQFVIDELQGLADSGDSLKRQRGRRGLDLLNEAKKEKSFNLTLWEGLTAGGDVDTKLGKLAKKLKARIATVDYNLNKAISVAGVKVLNVNDLANLVKTVVLPGEKLKVRIIQPGKEVAQGVAYLPDGTMVVVEGGRELIGAKEVEVEVSRLLQSSAGKMIFARLATSKETHNPSGS